MNRTYDIKPIPTGFNGVTYRSRLEARWAVFFNHLNVEALYEYEGFQLESGWYLPDFFIPSMKMWFEVKPDTLTEKELQLCRELQWSLHQSVGLLTGEISHRELYGDKNGFAIADDQPYYFCKCPVCGQIGFEFEGRGARVCNDKCCPNSDRLHTGDDYRLVDAFSFASRYQFEYKK